MDYVIAIFGLRLAFSAQAGWAIVPGMLEDIDVWRAANLLIKQHGADAELVAARRVDDMITEGDPAGETTWKRILAAVREMQRDKPAENERIN